MFANLSEEKSRSITERLTFGAWDQRNPDIFLQPLVGNASHVAWSPYVIQISNFERNMLKLMARGPKKYKGLADNLIGAREKVAIQRFGEHLKKNFGYQYKTRVLLPRCQGEIGLLAFHTKHPSQMLIVEMKSVLEVDDVNEMHQSTLEMISGQNQLRRVFKLLGEMNIEEKQRLWNQPNWSSTTDFYGLILTPSSPPNPSYDHREIPAVTLETVMRHFNPRQFRSPRSIWNTSVKKPWLPDSSKLYLIYQPLEVGGITYEIPVSPIES